MKIISQYTMNFEVILPCLEFISWKLKQKWQHCVLWKIKVLYEIYSKKRTCPNTYCTLLYMTEISLNVTLNNQIHSLTRSFFSSPGNEIIWDIDPSKLINHFTEKDRQIPSWTPVGTLEFMTRICSQYLHARRKRRLLAITVERLAPRRC